MVIVMRKEIALVLQKLTTEEKAECWSAINRGEWPITLQEYKPHEKTTNDVKLSTGWEIQRHIMTDIGPKECLRSWNKNMMNDEEFDRWYRGCNFERPRDHNN